MSYIFPAPGTASAVTLNVKVAGDTLGLDMPALQNVTINNGTDVMTWSQLDEDSKFQVPTTATNSLDMNIVLDQDSFFGVTAVGEVAKTQGVFGLSKSKKLISFELYMGDESDGGTGKTISGSGYITGLAPTVSADSPVWVTPITITVTGDYTVA